MGEHEQPESDPLDWLLNAQQAGLPPEQIAAMNDHKYARDLVDVFDHERKIIVAVIQGIRNALSGDQKR